jgi:hypothetical protein
MERRASMPDARGSSFIDAAQGIGTTDQSLIRRNRAVAAAPNAFAWTIAVKIAEVPVQSTGELVVSTARGNDHE